jgi:NitT/TauT family transport system substrate-binding protein
MQGKSYIAAGVTKNQQRIWAGHFGMAPFYYIYDQQGQPVEIRPNPHGAGQGQGHHDDPRLIARLLSDCRVFIGRRFGQESQRKLAQNLGIQPFATDAKTPEEAIHYYLEQATSHARPDTPPSPAQEEPTDIVYELIDARTLSQPILPPIIESAEQAPEGHGLQIIQSFEPIPLYAVLGEMGWKHVTTRQVAEDEFHAYFYRKTLKTERKAPALVRAPGTPVPVVIQSATPVLYPVLLRLMQSEALKQVIRVNELKVWKETEKHLAWIARGKADITFTAVLSAARLLQRKPRRLLMASVDVWNNFTLLTRDPEVRFFADLVGSTIYLPLVRNAPPYRVTEYLIKSQGLSPEDFVFVFGPRGAPFGRPEEIARKLTECEIDAALLREPETSYALANSPLVHPAIDYGQLWRHLHPHSFGLPNAGIVFKESLAEEHPQLIELFLDEVNNAMEWVLMHPGQAAEMSAGEMGHTFDEVLLFLKRAHLRHMPVEQVLDDVNQYLAVIDDKKPTITPEMCWPTSIHDSGENKA